MEVRMNGEKKGPILTTGAGVLVKSLEDLGVEHVFGYTGAAILPVYDELGKSSMKMFINSNEQSAAFSAAGYSRSSEKVGVVIVTSGPAITNTLTAVADSYADSIPLMVISGQVSENKIGTDSFQHIDVASVFGPTSKKVYALNSTDDIESVIKEAYVLAQTGKPGPVVIDVPLNIQQKDAQYAGLPPSWFDELYHHDSHLSDAQCREFFELLKQAKRPLLYVGGGTYSDEGSRALREFNELFHIPSVNTLLGKGGIDERDPLSMGMLGMFGTPYANMVIQNNDFFFAIGVRWDDRITEKVGFAIHAKIAYIDINPEKVLQIRKERSPVFSFAGEARTALNDLIAYARKHDITLDIDEWREEVSSVKRSWPLNYRRDGEFLQQAEVLDMLDGMLDEHAVVTTGVGNHQLLAAQYLRMRRPKSFLTSGSMATMGFGMPAAIGAQLANPNSQVVVVDGDGSFRMNMGEVHTIGTLQVPVKVLLFNNHSDGMVRNLEDAAYEGRHSATIRSSDVNFADLADICGFTFTRRISSRDELSSSLQEFLHTDGPALLEVITDPEEVLYPVVRPGKSYSDMELGPYIRKVE
jgi:acetolactate synthase-1/2/3 large subunit